MLPTEREISALKKFLHAQRPTTLLLKDLARDLGQHAHSKWAFDARNYIQPIVLNHPELGEMTVGEIQQMPLPLPRPVVRMATKEQPQPQQPS